MQHSSGNRANDMLSLHLSEIQPYTLCHPRDARNAIDAALGLQTAGKMMRGMKTVTETFQHREYQVLTCYRL